LNQGPHPGCKVCRHAKVDEINQAITRGDVLPKLVTAYGLSESSLWRHRSRHIMPVTRKSSNNRTKAAETSLEHMEALLKDAQAVIEGAKGNRSFGTWVSALREARSCIETISKIKDSENTRAKDAQLYIDACKGLCALFPTDILIHLARQGKLTASHWDIVRKYHGMDVAERHSERSATDLAS